MNSPHELSALIARLRQLQRDGFAGGAALTTITATRGSTFRRTGTSMLVLGSGEVVCALSGGCPQRDITERARQAIASGISQRVAYNQESGLDLLIEMGCGGELEVLIEPLGTADLGWLDALEQGLAARRPFWLATVFDARPLSAAQRPQRLLWHEQALLHQGLDDPALADWLRDHPQCPGSNGRPVLLGPLPDGRLALLERQLPAQALLVVGAGAAAEALAPVAASLGWEVCIADSQAERLAPHAAQGIETLVARPDALAGHTRLDAYTAAVVMTHNLEQDVAYLDALADSSVGYLGVLGSRERIGQILALTRVPASRLHAPAGLNLGSESPGEIALSITAEILATRNRRNGHPLRDTAGPLH